MHLAHRRTTARSIVMDISAAEATVLASGYGFVYVAIVTQPLTHQHKDSFIMITTSPLRALALRNAPNNVHRDMRDKVPYLYPEFVAGYFRLFALAADFADQLVVGRRGLPSKVRHACKLAKTFGVPCFHIAKRPQQGVAAFLRHSGAPPAYLDACARVAHATRVLRAYALAERIDLGASGHDMVEEGEGEGEGAEKEKEKNRDDPMLLANDESFDSVI